MALKNAVGRSRVGILLADADDDAKSVHDHIRGLGIGTVITAERGRLSDKPLAGKWHDA